MNSRIDIRKKRPAYLPIALLSLVIFTTFASVGYAEEPSSLIITTKRPEQIDFSASIRKEMDKYTETAIWMTRIQVGTDLGMKLGQPGNRHRVAANSRNTRG